MTVLFHYLLKARKAQRSVYSLYQTSLSLLALTMKQRSVLSHECLLFTSAVVVTARNVNGKE